MAIGYTTAVRNARMQAVADAIDGASEPSFLHLYTSPRPATGAAITTQVLLATIEIPYPCGSVANGVLTFNALVADASADATGVAAWARIITAGGTVIADLTVSVIGGSGDVQMNSTSIMEYGVVEGTAIRIITEGNP